MQDIRDLLQQLAQSQVRTQQQLDQTVAIASEASATARSNARSIQAWEALIEQNRVEAEEERSVLQVGLNEMRAGINELRVSISDLNQANRENVLQHMEFRERFDQTLVEIQRIWQRLDS